ncbi:SOS response-associated peptidase family protein [Roseibacillus persicicus]|uniref:SOS response-associated peptidase n=1 Tax=Roseibacillus persicicus TaxID=454148 RepID=UPI00398AFAF2
MCNAYDIGGQTGSFPSALRAQAVRELEEMKSVLLIRRTDSAPVLLSDGQLTRMSWGFRRPGLGVVNNSRSDKLEGPMWRESFEKRRCLIPVAGYFEWTGPKGSKKTFRFRRSDGELFWMAGLWEESPEYGRCFSMITTEANQTVAPIHHRMPALLETGEWESYLDGKLGKFAPNPLSIDYEPCANPLIQNPPAGTQLDLF